MIKTRKGINKIIVIIVMTILLGGLQAGKVTAVLIQTNYSGMVTSADAGNIFGLGNGDTISGFSQWDSTTFIPFLPGGNTGFIPLNQVSGNMLELFMGDVTIDEANDVEYQDPEGPELVIDNGDVTRIDLVVERGINAQPGFPDIFFEFDDTALTWIANDFTDESNVLTVSGTYAIDNPDIDNPGTGSSQTDPILPDVGVGGDGDWVFNFTPTPGLNFIDPVVAVGYDYIVNSGPGMTSFVLPELGDNVYDLYLKDASGNFVFAETVMGGLLNMHDFDGNHVSAFRILGIEQSLGLDPDDPQAFVTGISYESQEVVDFNMIAITQDVEPIPEPATVALLGIGLAGLAGVGARRKWKKKAVDKS